MHYERVLALGAHTDDIELGCGGLLSRLAREGAHIRCIAFSRAEESLPPDLASDTLEREFHNSMGHLRSNGSVVAHCAGFAVRKFPDVRQEILEYLVRVKFDFAPDLVITMNSMDTHQDHEVVHQESVRAFRGATVIGYELPWNQQQNVIELFAEIEEADVSTKEAMLGEYKSQIQLGRRYMTDGYARTAAKFRGLQARVGFAEAYEVITMQWRL